MEFPHTLYYVASRGNVRQRIVTAYRRHGYRLNEIAAHLATVSRRLARAEQEAGWLPRGRRWEVAESDQKMHPELFSHLATCLAALRDGTGSDILNRRLSAS